MIDIGFWEVVAIGILGPLIFSLAVVIIGVFGEVLKAFLGLFQRRK